MKTTNMRLQVNSLFVKLISGLYVIGSRMYKMNSIFMSVYESMVVDLIRPIFISVKQTQFKVNVFAKSLSLHYSYRYVFDSNTLLESPAKS